MSPYQRETGPTVCMKVSLLQECTLPEGSRAALFSGSGAGVKWQVDQSEAGFQWTISTSSVWCEQVWLVPLNLVCTIQPPVPCPDR